MPRKRISFSISSNPDTLEGQLIDYLRSCNKMLNLREATVRALKAYYLPWVYEDELPKEEVQVLARNAIDELEFRIFQIRRHFLAGEPYSPPSSLPPDPAGEPGGGAEKLRRASDKANGRRFSPAEDSLHSAALVEPAIAADRLVPDMLECVDIDPDLLDDF